jgi:tripartite-type tricarboxylate transporter receptor subunit TctC
MTHRRHLLALAGAAALALTGASSFAQAWPAKPITIVVAYPAGGDTDAMARLFAEKLTTRLGQTVVVDNKPGASGVIGSSFVSKAPADGYTLLLAPSTFSIAQLVLKTGAGAGYDVVNGFSPVIQTALQPLFIAAGTGAGARDLKELVAMAKAKPLTYASPGSGSPMHILGESFNKAAGIKISHVPYRGVAPAINDVLGGHVPVTVITYGPIAPHIASGKVVALAVADDKRSALAPTVPTLAELGYKGVELGAWQGLFAPKDTPPEIVRTLNTHLNEILKMPDVVQKMAVFGALPAGGTPERLAKTNADDLQRVGATIRELNIQAD